MTWTALHTLQHLGNPNAGSEIKRKSSHFFPISAKYESSKKRNYKAMTAFQEKHFIKLRNTTFRLIMAPKVKWSNASCYSCMKAVKANYQGLQKLWDEC